MGPRAGGRAPHMGDRRDDDDDDWDERQDAMFSC